MSISDRDPSVRHSKHQPNTRVNEVQYGGPLEKAEYWLQQLHQRQLAATERMDILERRVAWLERPWWQRIFRRPS